MNKGPQKNTVIKYNNYLKELILKHGLTRFDNVNLTDTILLKKYFPGNNTNLRRNLKSIVDYFKKIELIIDCDNTYLINEKSYYYSLDVAMLIQNEFLSNTKPNTIPDTLPIPCLIPNDIQYDNRYDISFNRNKVHFGRVVIDRSFDDKTINTILEDNFEQLKDYQAKIDELNSADSTWANLINMKPTIHRGPKGNVSSIGIRATQLCCSMITLKNHPDANYKKTREYFLEQMFGEWEEYDVKGSIPRLTRFCNTLDWIDTDVDPYYEMFGDFDFVTAIDNGDPGWTKHNRDIAKSLFMLCYFAGSPAEIQRSVIKKDGYFEKTKSYRLIDNSKIPELKLRVIKFCGSNNTKETGTFLHESCIYIDVMLELKNRNIPVFQVYDGFFFKKGTMPADMPDIIKSAAVNYYLKYGGREEW